MVRLMDTTRPRCVDENGVSLIYVCIYTFDSACLRSLKYLQVFARAVSFSLKRNDIIAPRIASSDQYLQNYFHDRVDT